MAEREPYYGTGKPGMPLGRGRQEGGAANQARQKADELVDDAQGRAAEAAEQVKQQATSRLTSQKETAAESVGSVAQAVHRTGSQLRLEGQGMVAEYAENAANQLDRISDYLRHTEIEDMVYEVENFARRQPAVFLGGALLLGFLGARFLRSSSPQRGMPAGPTRAPGQEQTGGGRILSYTPRFSTGHGYTGPGTFRGPGEGMRSSGFGSSGRPANEPFGGDKPTPPNPTGDVSAPDTGTPHGTTDPGATPQQGSGTTPNPRTPGEREGNNPAGGTGGR